MGKTKIEWTDATWNPIIGCSKISPGCDHCYAEKQAERICLCMSETASTDRANATWADYSSVLKWSGDDENHVCHGWNGRTAFRVDVLDKPLCWKKPRRIFVCSMGDLFHESVPKAWIDSVFAIMAHCKRHTFQVLTKRPARMLRYMRSWLAKQDGNESPPGTVKPLPNVHLGVTAENQEQFDIRTEILLKCPAAVRFVSMEPMLGPIDATRIVLKESDAPERGKPDVSINPLTGWYGGADRHEKTRLDWIIVGGETGKNARPMHPDWARTIRDQCVAAGVPFFFKSHGGKNRAGRLLDGREHNEFLQEKTNER